MEMVFGCVDHLAGRCMMSVHRWSTCEIRRGKVIIIVEIHWTSWTRHHVDQTLEGRTDSRTDWSHRLVSIDKEQRMNNRDFSQQRFDSLMAFERKKSAGQRTKKEPVKFDQSDSPAWPSFWFCNPTLLITTMIRAMASEVCVRISSWEKNRSEIRSN